MSKTVQGRSGAHSKASKRRKKQKNRLIIVVIEILDIADFSSSVVCYGKTFKDPERHKLQ